MVGWRVMVEILVLGPISRLFCSKATNGLNNERALVTFLGPT